MEVFNPMGESSFRLPPSPCAICGNIHHYSNSNDQPQLVQNSLTLLIFPTLFYCLEGGAGGEELPSCQVIQGPLGHVVLRNKTEPIVAVVFAGEGQL